MLELPQLLFVKRQRMRGGGGGGDNVFLPLARFVPCLPIRALNGQNCCVGIFKVEGKFQGKSPQNPGFLYIFSIWLDSLQGRGPIVPFREVIRLFWEYDKSHLVLLPLEWFSYTYTEQ